MILYCHTCYMASDWVENITGEDFQIADNFASESICGFGDVVYVGY